MAISISSSDARSSWSGLSTSMMYLYPAAELSLSFYMGRVQLYVVGREWRIAGHGPRGTVVVVRGAGDEVVGGVQRDGPCLTRTGVISRALVIMYWLASRCRRFNSCRSAHCRCCPMASASSWRVGGRVAMVMVALKFQVVASMNRRSGRLDGWTEEFDP